MLKTKAFISKKGLNIALFSLIKSLQKEAATINLHNVMYKDYERRKGMRIMNINEDE